MEVADLSMSSTSEGLASILGQELWPGILDQARRQGGRVLLAVLYDINTKDRNRTVDFYGTSTQVPDARAVFLVIRTDSGAVVQRGEFRAYARDESEPVLAAHATKTLITKYLVPSCPAIKPEGR
jgi:mRNA degradation ribonuclease J1/J2